MYVAWYDILVSGAGYIPVVSGYAYGVWARSWCSTAYLSPSPEAMRGQTNKSCSLLQALWRRAQFQAGFEAQRIRIPRESRLHLGKIRGDFWRAYWSLGTH